MPNIKQYCLFLLLILFNYSNINATDINEFVSQLKATGYVNDFAQMLSAGDKQEIENQIISINDSSSIQFGICLLDSLSGLSPNQLAKEIGNFWGVGQKETNNGTTILVSRKERAVYIATGLGTEKYVSDERVKAIIEGTLKPAFRQGDYKAGLKEAINKLYLLQKDTELDIRTKSTFNWLYLALILGLLILGFLLWMIFKNRNNKNDNIPAKDDELFGGGKFRKDSGAGGAW